MNILVRIDNPAKRIGFLFITIILIIILFIDVFSFKKVKNISVLKEAEDADEIIEGLRIVVDVNASNKKGIISDAPSHSVRAYAKYHINIPETGDYKFWARCRWDGACSNNFLVKMDDGNRDKFGGDPIYKMWIWSEGMEYNLTKGEHVFYVWNEENHAEMDKFLFTTDISNKPTGLGEFNSFTIDFEKNIPSDIIKYSKKWKILNYEVQEDDIVFRPENILKPDIIAQKLTDKTDFFNFDLRVFLPLDLKLKIDNGDFNSITPKEIADYFNIIIHSHDFLGTGYDRALSLRKSEVEKINYRRELLINNFREELTPLRLSYFNHSLYMKPGGNLPDDYINIQSDSPENYVFLFNYLFNNTNSDKNHLTVLFNLQDTNNYYNLELRNKILKLSKCQNGKVKELDNSKRECLPKNFDFDNMTIIRDFPYIIIKHNANTIISTIDSTFTFGNIAISSKSGDVYIDNIQHETSLDINFQRDFFGHGFYMSESYNIVHGYWYQTGDDEKYLIGRKNDEHDALVTFGIAYWKNYLYQCAVNFKNGFSIGLPFNIQDVNNYYMFKWVLKTGNKSVLQLIKVKNGITEVLDEKIKNYYPHLWHKVTVKSLNGDLSVSLHDIEVLHAKDTNFRNGHVGIWTDSKEDIALDDIDIRSINSLQENPDNTINYQFSNRSKVSTELSDWIPSNMDCNQSFGLYELTNKKLFENYRLLNRKEFTGNINVDFVYIHQIHDLQFVPLTIKGISPLLMFKCYDKKNSYTYVFRIEENNAVLYNNEKEIARVKGTGNTHFKISAQYQNNIWSFISDQDTLYYNPANRPDYYQIGFGFDGIGSINGIFPRINILEN